jgi:(R,R)-butanediol dehydrogenase / meso-butanediol dehydrogenase / diacetyl reductase
MMRAARFHGAGDVRVERVERPPDPGPGELLLRIAAAGICGSDALEYRAGPVLVAHEGPLILGHEFAGEVVGVGPGVDGVREGALVACGAGMSCGDCPPCRAGRTNLCTSYSTLGFQRHGGLAEACLVPAAICVDAGALPPDAAALAQPMAIAVHAARRGRVAEADVALIVGAGGIGAFLTFAAAQAGARVVVADLDARRLEIARALGASETVELDGRSTPGRFAPDVIFEASGSAAALDQAIALAPRGGRVVAVGVQKSRPPVDMRRVTLDELELIGTVAHVCRDDLPEALRLLALRRDGWGDVAPQALPLERVVEDGLRPLADGSSPRIKTLVDPWAEGVRESRTAPLG